MAKSIITDDVVAIMHFNSSVAAYYDAQDCDSLAECCFCHKELHWRSPRDPGASVSGPCRSCGRGVTYRTYIMSHLADYFAVQGGANTGYQRARGGVLHIVLPPNHPEWEEFVQLLSSGGDLYVGETETHHARVDLLARVLTCLERLTSAECDKARKAEAYHHPCFRLSEAIHLYGQIFSTRRIRYAPTAESRVQAAAPGYASLIMAMLAPVAPDIKDYAGRDQFMASFVQSTLSLLEVAVKLQRVQ